MSKAEIMWGRLRALLGATRHVARRSVNFTATLRRAVSEFTPTESSRSTHVVDPRLLRHLERRFEIPLPPEERRPERRVLLSPENLLSKTVVLDSEDFLFDDLDRAFSHQEPTKKAASSSSSSSRKFSAFFQQRRTYSELSIQEPLIEEVCPAYKKIENPQNDSEKDFNRIASILSMRLEGLMNDGFHRGSRIIRNEETGQYELTGRAKVIDTYPLN